MKHNVNYFRLLEEYFDGKLSQKDTSMLFEQMNRDPLLKAEFDLQSDIIESIKNERKMMLKEGLSTIQVGANPTLFNWHTLGWVAPSAALLGLMGIGFFLDFKKEPLPEVDAIEITTNNGIKWSESAQDKIEFKYNITPIESKQNESELDKSSVEVKEQVLNDKASDHKYAVAVEPDALTFENEISPVIEDEKLPSSLAHEKINVGESKVKDELEISLEENSKNILEYKYYNNKLYLFGDFGNEPYELLEVVNKKNREMYLFHSDKIYYVKPNTQNISKLIEIKDIKLIEELVYLKNSQ